MAGLILLVHIINHFISKMATITTNNVRSENSMEKKQQISKL